MKKTFVSFFSLLFIYISVSAQEKDTILFPLKIRIGADVFGPGYYIADKNTLAIEGFLSADKDATLSYALDGGYNKFFYSQYNYEYKCNGFFIRLGVDFNIISPFTSKGIYFAGAGLKYGISLYTHETPFFNYENYWGSAIGSLAKSTKLAHFIEASPGIRTELFPNFSIGWTIRLKILISPGTGKDLKPVYIPGYGNGTKSFSPGINYYLIWNIPYKEKLIIK